MKILNTSKNELMYAKKKFKKWLQKVQTLLLALIKVVMRSR